MLWKFGVFFATGISRYAFWQGPADMKDKTVHEHNVQIHIGMIHIGMMP
jgi:hypothetical protein